MEPKPPSVPVNVLELREPLQFGERTITELSFRKPIAKDMRALPGDPAQYSMGTLLDFAARLCGEPVSVIDRLSLEDTMTVVNLISGFFESSPRDWAAGLTELAVAFGWPPSELWELNADDLVFWADQAEQWSKRHGR